MTPQEQAKQLERLKEVVEEVKFQNRFSRQQQIVEAMNYKSPSYLSDVLNGSSPLSEKFILTFCNVFGVNPTYIKKGEGEMFEDTPKTSNNGVVNNIVGNDGNTTNTTNHTTNNYDGCNQDGAVSALLAQALNEVAAQRKLVSRAQEQIDRLLSLLESK